MKQRYHFTLILVEATRWLEYSSGMIAAQWAGTAQILVEVKIVPDSDIYFISTEGYLYDSKDNKAIFNATEALVNITANADSGEIVPTKPLSVKITAQNDNGSDYEQYSFFR